MGSDFMPKGLPNKRYTAEFKKHVVKTMLDYLGYYNNRRIKAKLKGLPPTIHRQQALSAAQDILLSNFLGAL